MCRLAILLLLAIYGTHASIQVVPSATQLAGDIYHSCLKDFSTSCVQEKSLKWFSRALKQDEIPITENLAIVRTGPGDFPESQQQRNVLSPEELMFDNIDNFLNSHALRVQAPEYFKTKEARALVPDYLWSNALTQDSIVPLTVRSSGQARGMLRKVILPFLLGLKFKTMVLVPLALGLIALKTWKAMTLGLLSLVLSGALIIFKIAKPKIVNYEVVHYPPAHVEHIEHFPHHVEHIVPHHIQHVPHHVDHHIDLPHHVDHVEHIEHASPAWEPQAWSRSSQAPKDAQDMAYAAQKL